MVGLTPITAKHGKVDALSYSHRRSSFDPEQARLGFVNRSYNHQSLQSALDIAELLDSAYDPGLPLEDSVFFESSTAPVVPELPTTFDVVPELPASFDFTATVPENPVKSGPAVVSAIVNPFRQKTAVSVDTRAEKFGAGEVTSERESESGSVPTSGLKQQSPAAPDSVLDANKARAEVKEITRLESNLTVSRSPSKTCDLL